MAARASFSNKVVAITGGGGGIGRALGAAFADAGAAVALLDRDLAAASEAASELKTAGRQAAAFACDVTDPDACRAAVAEVSDGLGGLDVLVNNAGISHRSLFADTDLEVLERVLSVNLLGSMFMTRAALEKILESRGQIIGISSVAGFAPLVGRTGYSASKHGLHGFLASLRAELRGSGVHVMLVCPAFVRTPLERNALDGGGRPVGDQNRTMVGQPMEAPELARAIVRGAASRRRLVLGSRVARAAYVISRVAPGLYERLMLRRQAGEFEF
jgi:NAD(P)-dependent dehydrogenase (short-subunit alcohol dehydrogenase family)